MSMELRYSLSTVYQHLLDPKVLELKINETKASCDQCAMAPGRAVAKEKGFVYQDHLKCCTFWPYLPNFAVGALLAEKNPFIENALTLKEIVLPVGVVAPMSYQIKFNDKGEKDFGNREDLLCPYFDKPANRCGIWRHRGSVCTSFFCASDYGSKGLEFWQHLEDHLSFVEMALMEEVLVQKGFSPRLISDNLSFIKYDPDIGAPVIPSEKEYRRLWSGFDDPKAFYLESFHLVKNLGFKQRDDFFGDWGKQIEKNLLSKSKTLLANPKNKR